MLKLSQRSEKVPVYLGYLFSEPILQWDLDVEAAAVVQDPADVSSRALSRMSTCTNEVAILGFKTLNPTPGKWSHLY